MLTQSPLSFAPVRDAMTEALAARAEQHRLLAPLLALLETYLRRIFDSLDAMITQWQAGTLPPPRPVAERPRRQTDTLLRPAAPRPWYLRHACFDAPAATEPMPGPEPLPFAAPLAQRAREGRSHEEAGRLRAVFRPVSPSPCDNFLLSDDADCGARIRCDRPAAPFHPQTTPLLPPFTFSSL